MKAFYHDDYFYQLPAGHSFPMSKFADAARIIERESRSVTVKTVPDFPEELLDAVHDPVYLNKLRFGTLSDEEIFRMGLPWRPELFGRSFLEVRGTLAAVMAAIEDGVSFNLAGGTHHAFPDRGQGFCILNDVATAIEFLWRSYPDWRILILDTDAHQGNANHHIFRNNPLVYTFSIHVARNFPSIKEPGDLDVGLERWVEGSAYMAALDDALGAIEDAFDPHFIIWITGVDLHREDRFGQMRLTTPEISERNRMVARWCRRRDVPVTAVYGGGYHREPGATAGLHAMTTMDIAGELGS